MSAVFGLLVMLLGVSCGVETSCDGRHDGALCYGALGGSVLLQLMDDASQLFRYQWKKDSTSILYGRRDKIVSNLIENRSSFVPNNGTFRINNLNRDDGGEYILEVYGPSGERPGKQTLQLIIQAPVSSVQLVSECLSQGEMRVSCSSGGGDSPQYSWTLNEQKLEESQLLSGNIEGQIITLKQGVSGRLVCTVRNQISRAPKRVKIESCGVETYCDGSHDGAQCYGALGGSVLFQLMNNTSQIFKYNWIKDTTTTILQGRRDGIEANLIENRSSFAPRDGTFMITKVLRTDAGEYTFKSFDSNGAVKEKRSLWLNVQAPVSSVQLVSECLSQGEMRVSCSSGGGDSPRYSWTLDGQKLKESQLYSGCIEGQVITLKQDVSGQLVCTVSNHISSVQGEKTISTCGFKFFDCTLTNGTYIKQWLQPTIETVCLEPTTPVDPSLLVCGLKAAAILVIIGIFIYFAWKKNEMMKAEGSAVPEEVEYENNSVVMVEMRSSAAEP